MDMERISSEVGSDSYILYVIYMYVFFSIRKYISLLFRCCPGTSDQQYYALCTIAQHKHSKQEKIYQYQKSLEIVKVQKYYGSSLGPVISL